MEECFPMTRVIIPLSLLLTIIALFGLLSFFNSVNNELREGDIEGVASVVGNKVVSEAESEIQNAIIEPFIPYIVGMIVFIASLFGIKLVIK